jgi:hypothetical protein
MRRKRVWWKTTMNKDTFAASDYGAWLQAWYGFESRYHYHKKSTPGFLGTIKQYIPVLEGSFGAAMPRDPLDRRMPNA